MPSRKEMGLLLTALGHELAHWAETSEALDQVIGERLLDKELGADDLHAVQELDSLAQHLRQLSLICLDVGRLGEGEAGRRLAWRDSFERINLKRLAQRLSGSTALDPEVHEPELW